MKKLVRFFRDEEGVVMVEYGLLAGMIGAALIVTLGLVTHSVDDMFGRIVSTLGK